MSMNIMRDMALGALTSLEAQEEGVQTALRDALSTVYLGNVIDIWQDQRQICVGSHAEFAKHLLAVHKEYCLDYCRAESQKNVAHLSLCTDKQCTHQTNDCQLSQSMKLSRDGGHERWSDFGPHFTEIVSENLENEKESDDDTIIDPNWVDDESDHEQDEEMDETLDVKQKTDELDVKPCVRSDCGATFSEMSRLESYMESHKLEKDDVPSECSKELSASRQSIVPVKEKAFVCVICDLMFENLNRFQAHMRTHTGETPKKQNVSSGCVKGYSEIHGSKKTTTMDSEEKPGVGRIYDELFSQVLTQSDLTKTQTIARPSLDAPGYATISNVDLQTKSTETSRVGEKYARVEQTKSSIGQLNTHMMTHANKKPHVCSDCSKGFKHSSSLKRHMTTHVQDDPPVCPECGKYFSHVSDLNIHMKNHTGVKHHGCSDCGRIFSQFIHLKAHMRIHKAARSYVCSDCGKGFSHSSTLKTHMLIHTGDKPHACKVCGQYFKHLGTLKIHTMDHTGERPHVCSNCGRGFSVMSRLKAHMMTHTGEKPHLCSVCGKAFSTLSQVKTHTRIHTGEKPHVCTDCGKGFSVLAILKRHIMTHTGERPHVCDQCGMRFTLIGNLKKHIMTHTGEKPHVCQECDKRFSRGNELKKHMRIHTGERPHSCAQCGAGFGRLEQLKAHVIAHTGETPHVCPDCGKGFATSRYLKRHAIIHTGEKPYVCRECGKGFNQVGNLKTHMKVHRTDTTPMMY